MKKKVKKNVKYRRMILPKILVDVLFLKLRNINTEELNPNRNTETLYANIRNKRIKPKCYFSQV
jgi:hypothetical protein